jgi:hypothetical protein
MSSEQRAQCAIPIDQFSGLIMEAILKPEEGGREPCGAREYLGPTYLTKVIVLPLPERTNASINRSIIHCVSGLVNNT